ncbi:MAG: ABC transporter ATP-binding protein [Brotaphodocola sp.]
MGQNENKILLDVQGLKKYYTIGSGFRENSRKLLKAVDDVSFQIRAGETCGLVGESGCGKSTLGRTILKLHSITEGSIVFDGEHIANYNLKKMRPLRKDMQMIFQDPYASLSPRMTILDSVKAPLDIQGGMNEAEKLNRVRDILSYVGVTEQHINKYPHELSGGQRQRVVIARAMITNPKFVVCDEPVSALDVSVRAQVLNLMRKLQQETGVSYLFISHDLSVVRYLCETVMVMYLGKIVEKAEKKSLYENPMHPYTRALMSAIPIPDIHVSHERTILQGDIPNPVNPPTGCHFHTRCPYATEQCGMECPELREMETGHFVACHRAGKI